MSQVQDTVASAIDSLKNKINPTDKSGNPTGEKINSYQPKAYLVIGSMNKLIIENSINKDKLKSFELFRKNICSLSMITFDELYERARFIVLHNQEHKGV